MLLSQLTTLVVSRYDTRALPRAAHEKVAEAKARIELYNAMNPNFDVRVSANAADSNDVRRAATSDRAVTVALLRARTHVRSNSNHNSQHNVRHSSSRRTA
jgi:hypothetical protein